MSGKLTPEQAGVYWTVCALIYSKGGTIDNDPKWLGNIMGGTHWRTMKRILSGLVNSGKITARDGQLGVQRCCKELAKTEHRISTARANGLQGGRPPNKNNNLDKPKGFKKKKLTLTTNHQPLTTNLSKSKRISDIRDLVIDDDLRKWGMEHTPDVNLDDTLQSLIGYCSAHGKKYKDYRAALQNFARSDQKKGKTDGKRTEQGDRAAILKGLSRKVGDRLKP